MDAGLPSTQASLVGRMCSLYDLLGQRDIATDAAIDEGLVVDLFHDDSCEGYLGRNLVEPELYRQFFPVVNTDPKWDTNFSMSGASRLR
jgi:hypothetical protein